MDLDFDKSVGIFVARENPETISTTISSVLSDISRFHGSEKTIVDVLVNGNRELSLTLMNDYKTLSGNLSRSCSLRIWYIPFADKAHAWNEYLHSIWPGADLAYFVDGYAQVQAGSISSLAECLTNAADALAATGVPSSGSSAVALREEMLTHGGFHGSLHTVRGATLAQMRGREFRLPIGLYRTDALIGAVIMFGLEPGKMGWDPKRIVVDGKATWHFRANSVRSFRDLIAHWKRMSRQARGKIENLAVRQHMAIERKTPQALPEIADDLIREWLRGFPISAAKLFLKNPLTMIAARQAFTRKDWSAVEIHPVLVASGD